MTSVEEAGRRTGGPTRVRFLLEQHVGHRTYAENLLEVARERDDIVVEHVAVDYGGAGTELPGPLGRFAGAWSGRRTVRSALARTPADVDVYNTQVPAALAGRSRRRPYVIVTDVTPLQYDAMAEGYGHVVGRVSVVERWKHRVNATVFAEAAMCVAWSNWVAQSLRADYSVPDGRIAVIPPGVDHARWRRPEPRDGSSGRVEILFVGGEFERKGGDLVLDAFSSLPSNVHMTLVTRAPVRRRDRVTVIDDLTPNDPRLVRCFHEADIFALPTRAETFGIAAVEASAAGLPVVATRLGGLADIVDDGVSGFLLPPGDAADLRGRLAQLVDDADLRRSMGAAAQRRAVERFDASINASRLVDLAIASTR